jgi:hypothetical protein
VTGREHRPPDEESNQETVVSFKRANLAPHSRPFVSFAVEIFLFRVHSRSKTACKVYLISKDTNLGYFEVGPTLRTSGGNTDEAVISHTPRAAWKRGT